MPAASRRDRQMSDSSSKPNASEMTAGLEAEGGEDAFKQEVENGMATSKQGTVSSENPPKQNAGSAKKTPKWGSAATEQAAAPVHNTNRWDTKTLVTMALFATVGVLLSYIEIPLFPPAPYLKFDPSFITAMVGAFLYGPVAGIIIGILQNVVHGLFSTGGGMFGALMNCAIAVAYVWPASLIYKRRKVLSRAVVGLVLGIVCGTLVAILMNMWITPLYTAGATTQMVIAMIVPVLIPFNLIKLAIDSVLTMLVYKPVSNMLKPAKERRGKGDASTIAAKDDTSVIAPKDDASVTVPTDDSTAPGPDEK